VLFGWVMMKPMMTNPGPQQRHSERASENENKKEKEKVCEAG
jgi:hypothetical protein